MFITDECYGKWKKRGDYCYIFKRRENTWQEASKFCKSQNAQLTSIEDQDENDFIQGKLPYYRPLYYKNK